MTTPRALASRLRGSVLARNTVALYGVHLANLALPLVTVPFLARVLRPEGWGLVVFAQSFAAGLGLVAEYGFHLSATRMVAREKGSRERLAAVVAGVNGAKLALTFLLTVGAGIAYIVIPAFQANPTYLFWAWLLAVAQGATPFWYFQGMERMGAAARLEVGTRIAATAGILLLVRQPEDGWLVLCMYALAGMVWVGIGTAWIHREVPLRRFDVGGTMHALREGFAIFALRGASGLYMQANGFVLGLISNVSTVAYFGGAERIIRAAVGVIQPVSQALYPRLSRVINSDREAAARLLRISAVAIVGLGLIAGVLAAAGAPLLVRLLLGPGYEAAVPVLRVLALLPPIIALATVIGIQWALPMGYDRKLLSYVLCAGGVNLVGALLLVPRMGALGMAVSVVLAEAVVMIGLVWLARRHGEGLWTLAPGAPIVAARAEVKAHD